ncbi:MAG: hypothetical protein AAGG81_08405 [Chlamydiota bacterium]
MKTNWIRPIICFTLVMACLSADESEFEPKSSEFVSPSLKEEDRENRVPVGDRRVSMEDHVALQEKRSLLAEERFSQHDDTCDVLSNLEGEDFIKRRCLSDREGLVSKGYYTSHEGAFHRPISITLGGDMVTLEDGSVWKVRAKDKCKTFNWLAGDSIIILPNHSWFSTYYYVLHNQNTGEDVQVNLVLGPIYNGIYTHWVVAIDYYNQEVCLEDGSIWKISGSDYSTMKKWLVNDTIIIGINDSWFSSKPNILINVNTLTYSAAVCEN